MGDCLPDSAGGEPVCVPGLCRRLLQVVVLCLVVGACSQVGGISDETTTTPIIDPSVNRATSTSAQTTTTAPEVHEVPEDGFTVVVVFLEDSMMNASGTDASPGGQTLMSELAGIDGVLEVWLVDKAEAVDEARQLFSSDPEMLAAIESNPRLLPASIRIRVVDRTAEEAVVNRASNRPGVKEVKSRPTP